jgi:hypothetical protein
VTAGKEFANCYAIPVHTAIVVDFAGQKMLIEMGPGGIRRVDFLRYEFELSRRWIIDIRRHPAFDDKAAREEAQARLIHRWRQHVEKKRICRYGWGDLLTFVLPMWRDNPRRTICSELYVEVTKDWIPDYDPKVPIYSPYALSKILAFRGTGWQA